MSEKKLKSKLCIRDLELRLHLGWPDNERLKEQTVYIQIEISFHELPRASRTDKLEDTFCYSKLINLIKEKTLGRHFHLIEHLTGELYNVIKELMPEHDVLLSITKYPAIEGLKNGVTFTCWEQ